MTTNQHSGHEYENILLITIDCFRYDRCGFSGYKYPTTPFLDQLSEESYIFDAAYSTGPYTPESFPGIFAGLHANATPYASNLVCKAIPHNAPTFPKRLQDRGWTTLATVTNTHLSRNRNFDRGFDHFENIRLESSKTMVDKKESSNNNGLFPDFSAKFRDRLESKNNHPNILTPLYTFYRRKQINDWPTVDGVNVQQEIVSNINKHGQQPFFGWCHFMDAHAPIHPDKEPKVHNVGGRLRQLAADSARIVGEPNQRCSKMYDNAIRYIDFQIEKLFKNLDEKGLLNNTAVIITGDHGEGLGERGVYNHPWHYMYDELSHVPLLVWTPDDTGSGERITTTFSLGWLHELVGNLISEDLGDFPTESEIKNHFSTTQSNPVITDSVSELGYSLSIHDGNHKYVKYDVSGQNHEIHTKNMGKNEILLDISSYPNEESIISGRTPEEYRELERHHRIDPEEVPKLSESVSKEAENHLKQLGYL